MPANAGAVASELGAAAAAYLRCGWAIVPVPYRKKAPVLPGWPQVRLTPGDLVRYFNDRRGNVGVLLGRASHGLVDVDLDGAEALALAERFLPVTPAVFGRAGKPRSHRLYVCEPVPVTVRFRAPGGGTLVELRADGCQTIVPPSVHPSGEAVAWAGTQERGRGSGPPEPAGVSGEELARAVQRLAAAALLARVWPARGSRHEAALALAGALGRAGWRAEEIERFVAAVAAAAGDEELRDRIRAAGDTWRRQAAGAATTGLRRLAGLVGEREVTAVAGWLGLGGQQHGHQVLGSRGAAAGGDECGEPAAEGTGGGKYAGRRGTGASPAQERGDGDAARRTPGAAGMWEPPAPLLVHDVPAFPVDALPQWLARYVRHVAVATQTPPDLAGMLALAVVAAAVQGRMELHVRADWTEPLSLFVTVALPSGERKTAVFREVTAPLAAWEQTEAERLGPEVAAAESARRIKVQQLERLEQQAAKAPRDEAAALAAQAADVARELASVPVPVLGRWIADDCTPERAARLLAEQGGRLAIFSDEADVFDIMRARYGNAPNFGVFLRGHAGSPLRVDRVGRAPLHVERPALTLGVAAQPHALRGLADEPALRGRGLLARIWYAWPRSLVGTRDPDPPPVPVEVRDSYHGAVQRLLRLPAATDTAGRSIPHVLRLDDEALGRVVAFLRALEPRLGPDGDVHAFADWGGKLAGAVVRVAGLLHCAAWAGRQAEGGSEAPPWAQPVGRAALDAALRLGCYALEHARYTFAEMGTDARLEEARYLLRRLGGAGRAVLTKRDLFELAKGRLKTVEQLDPVLALLITHGYLRERAGERVGGPGRRPAAVYEVHPALVAGGATACGRGEAACATG
jgi:replicative DNA helicase